MQKWLLRVSLFFALLLAFTPAHAQDNASMAGIVTDSTGAVVPDTEIVLTNPARGIHFTAKTNGKGEYLFPNVPPAPGYVISFTHTGFAETTIKDFSLVVGSTRTQDAKLVAGASTVLEVSASNALVTLNTTDATIGNNLDIQALNDLPVQNRNNPVALFVLQPGVNQALSVTGARTDQSSVTVDGMDVNDISTGSLQTIVGQIPVDATQEFRGTVAGLTSNLGTGSGGQFQLVTKSGTNRFHGDVNEYHRDTQTVSNPWFNNVAGVARAKYIRNQFGGAIGGPILKDRLFFFADFYNSRIVQALSTSRTVPLDSFRAGNIMYVNNTAGCAANTRQTSSNAATCLSTYTPAQVAALDPGNTTTGQRGENGTIFSLLNSRYPHVNDPTGGDGINTGLYRFTQGTTTIEYDGVARVDYNITSKQRAFVQFHEGFSDGVQSQNRFAGDPLTRPNQNRSYGYVASHIWQIGSNKVNQF